MYIETLTTDTTYFALFIFRIPRYFCKNKILKEPYLKMFTVLFLKKFKTPFLFQKSLKAFLSNFLYFNNLYFVNYRGLRNYPGAYA